MFYTNLIYELKFFIRSKWLFILLASLTILFIFSVYNGSKNISKRTSDIHQLQNELHKKDSLLLVDLSKLEKGEQLDLPNWKMPSNPMAIGYNHPRLAIMPAQPLALVATGQSDMYTHFKKPTIYGNNFALDYAEMINPIQLLFGNFDVSFVIIYILPLLIIAFTFNSLSKEKELGTLRLLGTQPVSIIKWLLQKMAIKYIVFTFITFVIFTVVLFIFSPISFHQPKALLELFLLVSVYILFWFVLAYFVNIKVHNSSKNALVLIGVWLLVVLVIPASINQVASSIYPIPSRLHMINEIRQVKKDSEKKQDKILDDFLRTHPELANNTENNFGFWHKYLASEKLLEEKTKPLLVAYEQQLKNQQKVMNICKYLSPSILMQQSLNTLAGTSENHYNDYKKQVVEFSDTWRSYLTPMLFKNDVFTKKHYDELPEFSYQNRVKNDSAIHLAVMLFISILLFLLSRVNYKVVTLFS